MWWKCYDRKMLMGALLMAVLLTACARDDDADGVQLVKTQLNFSLPRRIVSKQQTPTTRMTPDVVQESGKEEDFRGLDDVHLLCFENYPTQTSTKIGGVIEMKTSGGEVSEEVTKDDYSLCQEINIPVGTSFFAFYARAADVPKTHEERMKYGIIETVGLGKTTYQGNSAIRFRPVPICSSTEAMGGSRRGQILLELLNELMNVTVDVPAPNNKLSTVNNLYLHEARQRLMQLKTLSSQNVQTMLGFINLLVNQEAPDDQGSELTAAVKAIIASCTKEPYREDDQIELKDIYQGFPEDIHLPAGAARIEWDKTKSKFVEPDVQAYGKSLNVASINDYVYPMNLQYQIFSDLLASDKQVIFGEEGGTGGNQYETWQELLDEGYESAKTKVQTSTQSVAMVQQVEYAVGRLALCARLTPDNIYDANGAYVSTYDGVFTLKGYIIGGQREVDYNFQPVEGSPRYAIYDTELNNGEGQPTGSQTLKRHYYSEPDYILGLGTAHNEKICLAMELVNNGNAFQGADGVIVPGATFYLVAEMDPQEGTNYTSGSLDQIFCKDHATRVNLTIKSLATATYGLPSLELPHPTVGVSVNLSWGEGLWFEEEL